MNDRQDRPRQLGFDLSRIALLALCLLAFAWRLAGIGSQSLWRDEVDSIRFATQSLADLLGSFTRPGENGPLFFLSLRPWLALAGQSEFALRFPSVMAGVLAIPLTFMLARRLWRASGQSPPAAERGLALANVPLLSALLVAVSPYLVWYSQEGKMYAPLLALALAANLALLAAVEHGTWLRWLVYLGTLVAAVLVHVLAVLIVPVHLLWLVFLWPASRRSFAPFMGLLLALAVPYVAVAGWWQLRLFTTPDFQTGHAFVPLPDMAGVLITGFARGMGVPRTLWVVAPVIFLVLAGAVLGPGREGAPSGRIRLGGLLLSWLLLPAVGLFLITLRKPLFTDRYLIWVLPALAMLLALGIAALAHTWRPLGWAMLAGLIGLGLVGGWRQMHVPIKSDFRAAAAYVEARRQPDDRLLFLIPYSRYPYEYYAGLRAGFAEGPYTNNDNPLRQVEDEMARATADAPAVWLIASEEEMWDSRGLVRQWLEQHGRTMDSAAFTRVRVDRYDLLAPAVP